MKFGQFDVILPGSEENKVEDNIITDYNEDFPVEYQQYDYGSDEALIANYDIARVTVVVSTTEPPYEVTTKVNSISSVGEESIKSVSSDDNTINPEVTSATQESTSTPTAATKKVPSKVSGKEASATNKLDKSKKVNSVKSGEEKKSASIGVATTVSGDKKGLEVASTETPRVAKGGADGDAKEGADEVAEQGEEVEKKGTTGEESIVKEAKDGLNATDDSKEIVEDVEEVLQKSLTRGQLTVAVPEKSEASETESPAVKTSAPFSRFKPPVPSVAGESRLVSEIDEKPAVTIPSVFRFLPTLSSRRGGRPSLRERGKALRAIATLSKAIRTSTQSSSETSSTTIIPLKQKTLTASPKEEPRSPAPLRQPLVQIKETKKVTETEAKADIIKETDVDKKMADRQELGLKGDSSASPMPSVGEPLLRDPIGAVWETDDGQTKIGANRLQTNIGDGPTSANQLRPNKDASTETDELSKAQLQEKLKLLQEKLARLASDAEVLTKKPTQTTTMSTTTQSPSSLVTGPIKVVRMTTSKPPTSATMSSHQQPTRAPTTQMKATTLPSQEQTKFPNFPTSNVQDELRAAVEVLIMLLSQRGNTVMKALFSERFFT